MRLDDEQESSNVEDRRGMSMGRAGGVGIGTVLLALVASYFFGIDPQAVIGVASQMQSGAPPAQAGRPPADDPATRQVRKVLGSTERTWGEIFRASGRTYEEPTLVLFSGATPTACGTGDAAMGPFYCPGDRKVYIDLAFYDELARRFHAPGNAAQAYVIAHEVGHHVQNLLGTSEKVQAARQRARSQAEANALSVRLELQADCYAGVWMAKANEARHILEQGDLEGILTAAAAIGDDTLQKQARGRVVPDSFTHGSAAQRMQWFKRGIERGDPRECNTFAGR